MKILLVEPPFHSFMQYDRWYYPTSLAQLAAIAHEAGHEVIIYDADRYFYKDPLTKERDYFIGKQHLYYDNVDDFEHEIWRHFKGVLEDINPDVVGVSVYTCKLKSATNVLKLVREFNPDVKTCVGGAHVTAVPETLVLNKDIDALFCGHSDLTFPKWLQEGFPRGVIHGDASKIDLSKIPYARRQALMFPENYTSRDLSIVMTSRGCVGQCTFCSNSFMWSGLPRFRTSKSIATELTELFDEWKIDKEIMLGDASFCDVPQEAKRVAGVLKDFGVRWEACVRWAVSKELLEYFMECGCTQIHVGMEAGSDKILKYMRKGCTRETIREKAKMINSLGIKWHLFSIGGFPVETIEDMNETMELALEIEPTSISFNSLSPLPGTDVYNNISGMTPEDASKVGQLSPTNSFSEHIDLETFKDNFVRITKILDEYNEHKKRGWGKQPVSSDGDGSSSGLMSTGA